MKNTNKGITLIALVITIIVMLILVAVTINMAVNGGLFDFAGRATGETQNAINKEQAIADGAIKIGDVYYTIGDYLEQVIENNDSRIKLTYTITPAEDNLSAVITVNARMLGGLLENYKDYEEWALEKLEGKSEAQKIQMFIDGDVFWYQEDYSGIENVTIDDVLAVWDCETIEDCWQEEFDSFEEALISWKYVYPDQYEYGDDYYMFAKKELRGKTDAEIEQIFVDGQNYWNDVDDLEEPTYANINELVAYWSENFCEGRFDDVAGMVADYGYNTLADMAIDMERVSPEKYYDQAEKKEDSIINMMDPDGEIVYDTKKIEYTVDTNGEYIFKAVNENGTESNSVTVKVDIFED